MSRQWVAGLGWLTVVVLIGACGSSRDATPPTQPEADADIDVEIDGEAGPQLPPRICKSPSAPAFPWFKEITKQVGLAATDTLEPAGTCVVSADFDGDGYPDLISLRGESTRGLVDGKRVRFLMMNRPDPSDATGKARVFVDVPEQGGLLATREGTQDRGASIAMLGDLNNDGAIDVVTCPSDFTTNTEMLDPCVAFLNDGKAQFKLAAQSDIDAESYPATSAVLLDADRDGILDFWPAGMAHWFEKPGSNWNTGPRLFRGKGDGTFSNVTESVGLPTEDGTDDDATSFRHTFGMTACDLDNDGDQDVILASYGREENQVWRNDGNKFVNVAHQLGLDHDDREDYSDDESYRCYCAATGKCDPAPPAPVVPCNSFGNPYFRGWIPGLTDQPWGLGGNNFGVTCGDFDADGDQDVVFATVVHGDVGASSDPTELILNPGDGTKFSRPGNDKTGLERKETGYSWNHGDNIPIFVDVDLDGRADLFDASAVYPGSRCYLWHQTSNGTFEEIAAQAGIAYKTTAGFVPQARGVDFIDFDNDGDLDLLVGTLQGSYEVRLFRNNIGQDSNFIRVRLQGKGAGYSNVAGIGARVRVTAGGRTQTQEVHGGQGIGNIQADFVLTFGLGAVCDVDEIEVHWPDAKATVTKYSPVRANYNVLIREGESAVTYQ